MRIFVQANKRKTQVFPASGKPHCQWCGLAFTASTQICTTCGAWQVELIENTYIISQNPNWKPTEEDNKVLAWVGRYA